MKGVSEQLEEVEDQADLIPMIDCVLLMLMFFVVTASFSDENAFPVELPTAATSVVRDQAEATVIAVSKTGAYAIGSQTVSEDRLLPTLRERHGKQPIKTLVVAGDKGCPYEKVVLAVDAAHALGIGELCLTVASK